MDQISESVEATALPKSESGISPPQAAGATAIGAAVAAGAGTVAARVGRLRWSICALLFFATTINYVDRQVLALIKEFLDRELGWTNEQFGLVNSAFQGA